VLAQIVFALTQKPIQNFPEERGKGTGYSREESIDVDKEVDECEDLLSKLNLAIADGPPTHLEQGKSLVYKPYLQYSNMVSSVL
jgi:hypothetical protein